MYRVSLYDKKGSKSYKNVPERESSVSIFSDSKHFSSLYIYIYTYCSLISEEEILDSLKLKTGNSWLSSVA